MQKGIFKILLVLTIALFIACNSDDSKNDSVEIDQSAFIENNALIIQSAYLDFNVATEALKTAVDSLVNHSSASNLQFAQAKLEEAYKKWQWVNFYEFGPATNVSLKHNLNIYKTDTSKIETRIANSDYDFDKFDVQDAMGFPALDYLLNSNVNSVNQIAYSGKRQQYLVQLINDLSSRVSQVNAQWQNEYFNRFKEATGTDVGSATGMMVNALNQHFEKYFRDNKVGVPLGVRSSGIAKPDFVEAYYGGYSLDLIKENLTAMKSLYLGGNGYGFDDYLTALDAQELNTKIIDQMVSIEQKVNLLTNPLTDAINNNPQEVQAAYNEMQKLIVLLKVDLPSRMGILITYQDNDGD